MLSQEQKTFIKENYPSMGALYCAEKLNIKKYQVHNFAHKQKIKIDNEKYLKSYNRKHIFKLENFSTKIDQYSAYILGFIWADGYLNKNNGFSINIEILTKDAEQLKYIFLKTGDWCFYNINSPSKKKWQPQTKIQCNNKELFNFLKDNDYVDKSISSPDKILSKIPKEYHNYFFRGLSDGDGCFYFKEHGRKLRQYCLTSNIFQNWDYIENLLLSIDVKKYKFIKNTRINKKTGKLNSSSIMRITNKSDIKKFGDYIYSGELFGLDRKYEIFKHISS